MWPLREDVQVISSPDALKVPTVQFLALCCIHWTGRAVQTVQVKGQPDAELRVQKWWGSGQAVGWCSGDCLFYKQWEQISTGASLGHVGRMSSGSGWGGALS